MLGPQPWASQGTRELIHIAWSFGPQVAEAAMKVFPPCPVNFVNPLSFYLICFVVLSTHKAGILERAAIPFSTRSPQLRDQIWVFGFCRQIMYHLSHQGSPHIRQGNINGKNYLEQENLVFNLSFNCLYDTEEVRHLSPQVFMHKMRRTCYFASQAFSAKYREFQKWELFGNCKGKYKYELNI